MIIRVPHRKRFTMIANAALRDKQLSFRATGILAYLLSLPDGSSISGRRLAEEKAEGRDAIMTALAELEKAGYLLRERAQMVDGKWTTTVTIQESPSPENPDSVPGNPPPSPGNQDSVYQDSVFQDLKTLKTNNEDLLGATPGNPTPKWAAEEHWQDDKGRWWVGPRPKEDAAQ